MSNNQKKCKWCSRHLDALWPTKVYCNDACKQAAYYHRRKEGMHVEQKNNVTSPITLNLYSDNKANLQAIQSTAVRRSLGRVRKGNQSKNYINPNSNYSSKQRDMEQQENLKGQFENTVLPEPNSVSVMGKPVTKEWVTDLLGSVSPLEQRSLSLIILKTILELFPDLVGPASLDGSATGDDESETGEFDEDYDESDEDADLEDLSDEEDVYDEEENDQENDDDQEDESNENEHSDELNDGIDNSDLDLETAVNNAPSVTANSHNNRMTSTMQPRSQSESTTDEPSELDYDLLLRDATALSDRLHQQKQPFQQAEGMHAWHIDGSEEFSDVRNNSLGQNGEHVEQRQASYYGLSSKNVATTSQWQQSNQHTADESEQKRIQSAPLQNSPGSSLWSTYSLTNGPKAYAENSIRNKEQPHLGSNTDGSRNAVSVTKKGVPGSGQYLERFKSTLIKRGPSVWEEIRIQCPTFMGDYILRYGAREGMLTEFMEASDETNAVIHLLFHVDGHRRPVSRLLDLVLEAAEGRLQKADFEPGAEFYLDNSPVSNPADAPEIDYDCPDIDDSMHNPNSFVGPQGVFQPPPSLYRQVYQPNQTEKSSVHTIIQLLGLDQPFDTSSGNEFGIR